MASAVPSFQFATDENDHEPQLEPAPAIRESTVTLRDSLYDNSTLSPLSARFPPIGSRLSPYSPSAGSTTTDTDTPSQPTSAHQPFTFAPQQYVVSRPPGAIAAQQKAQTELGRRRGHKYARSSVSHQIILSPTPRLPLQLPTSLPIPTLKEFRASMTRGQRGRWLFCGGQLLVAGYVQWQAHEAMAMAALSHLLFFDALSAMLRNAVLVGRNFEVWTRSSLRHPFGLERSELVAGLAMSIVLLFMGIDLTSHGLTHSLENVGGHEAHHAHSHLEHDHDHDHVGGARMAALLAILVTLVSATVVEDGDSHVGKSVHPSPLGRLTWLPRVLRDPSHLLILACATILITLPLINIPPSPITDNTLAFLIAFAMIFLGTRSCYSIGRVLLMSYPVTTTTSSDEFGTTHSDELKELVAEIWEDEAVAEVQEAKVWQVHYGLCVANFKLKVRRKEDVQVVREKIKGLVERRLAGESSSAPLAGTSNTRGRVRWEMSSMITVVDGE